MTHSAPLLSTDDVAELLNVTPAYVRAHAAEMGAIRLGGSRGPLRFEEHLVRGFMESRRLEPPPAPSATRRRPGPRRKVDDVKLLPLPPDIE
jgi:hypothetical protein